MTIKELIKEIEWGMDVSGAMVCIENLGISVIAGCLHVVYGIKRFNGMTYFVSGPGKDGLICPVKWNRFKKDDLLEIYERINSIIPEIHSRKDSNGHDFYKIWL